MNASQKTLCIFLIIILLYFNFIGIFDLFFSHVFSGKIIVISLIRLIPLLLLFIYYFTTKHSHDKLSINHYFFIFSISFLVVIQIYRFLYCYLLIDKINSYFILIMYLLFLLFFLLAFHKNFKKNLKTILLSFVVLYITLHLQLVITIITGLPFLFSTYTNPNRYEFVKQHYLTESEFHSLPNSLPKDATNIVFEYFYAFEDKGIYLEYDSQTVNNEEHHAKYEISYSLKKY